jgi:hypothetical protein
MPLYPDVAAMLSAHGLDAPEVTFEHDGYSHAEMSRLRQGADSYVLKRTSCTTDWIIQMTTDHALREAQLASADVTRSLPEGLRSPSIAAAHDGDGFALLMCDLAPYLLPQGGLLADRTLDLVLARLAAMHAQLWCSPPKEGIGWCGLRERLLMLSEPAGRRLQEAGLMEFGFAAGWERFHAAAPPEASRLMRRLHDDPSPLLRMLGDLPPTLLHNDVKVANMAVDGETVWLFDWALAGIGPVCVELAWFLTVNSSRLGRPLSDVWSQYLSHLESVRRITMPETQAATQFGLMQVCGLLLMGWAMATGGTDFRWWCDGAVDAGKRFAL